jgi:hypothetical protein
VSVVTPYVIPSTPPPELLAELDAATEALDRLAARAAELTFVMDEQARRLRVELRDSDGSTALTPSELFALLRP